MTLIIAGQCSGVGKTTVTLALLAALKSRGLPVQSFKVGPDYIDPMFHDYVTGSACRNLDPILTSEDYVKKCFTKHLKSYKYALIEGVMGLFDGVSWSENIRDYGSTAHIARLLDVPVLLVVDCARLSGSVAAIVHGYSSFDSRLTMAGLVLNRVGSDRHLELLTDALKPLNLPILGVLRRSDEIGIPDRHLGLVPSQELPELDQIINKLADLGNHCFDWEQLLPLLEVNNSQKFNNYPQKRVVKIALAKDKAFNFYYQDNIDILEELGAEIIEWSPLTETMPAGVGGLYFGGGFPEVFAQQLSDNINNGVREAILGGMPVYAECGGLMYLCQEIIDFTGTHYSMLGILPTKALMGKNLTLGYRQCQALQPTPLLAKNSILWGHEFHRSHLKTETLPSPVYQVKPISNHSQKTLEGWGNLNLHASYVHLHWGATPELPARFIESCKNFHP